ncbi:MAG: exosome complex RNA-binding protein Csl4 [Candidatus Hodarchaeaceae archaeon]|nr:exosome complex RNA-binding protein Csl4 [Candidatus Hodarchaeaceae archaeon]
MVEVRTGDFVVPGDFLATTEEFVPGEGAYEEGGKIYASSTGVVLVDARMKRISVFSRVLGPPTLKRDDVVVGRVDEVRDQSANVYIGVLRGREDRELPLPNLGMIHISQTHTGYVKDLAKQFKPGDIVRARVLNARREPVQLTTAGDELGVIVAACSRCRALLEREGTKLRCPNCGNVEFRKLANDYRQGVL